MIWEETLLRIFAGYVNQQTLEEGADQMAFVTSDNRDIHVEFLEAVEKGLASIETDCEKVMAIINQSGYQVVAKEGALIMLQELLRLYLDRYTKMVESEVPLTEK